VDHPASSVPHISSFTLWALINELDAFLPRLHLPYSRISLAANARQANISVDHKEPLLERRTVIFMENRSDQSTIIFVHYRDSNGCNEGCGVLNHHFDLSSLPTRRVQQYDKENE
jgi:hypothetical protein